MLSFRACRGISFRYIPLIKRREILRRFAPLNDSEVHIVQKEMGDPSAIRYANCPTGTAQDDIEVHTVIKRWEILRRFAPLNDKKPRDVLEVSLFYRANYCLLTAEYC